VRAEYLARFGRPLTEEGNEAEFAAIALGKLGGRELNFSSDIDLMFVYEGEGKPENRSGWDNFVYFSKLAVDLVALLTASTNEGCLYRVDTRLRPEGSKGALVRSLPSMELYYESWGETGNARRCCGRARWRAIPRWGKSS
jgi:glutamate-ammonia-ligase adenylyltransferase